MDNKPQDKGSKQRVVKKKKKAKTSKATNNLVRTMERIGAIRSQAVTGLDALRVVAGIVLLGLFIFVLGTLLIYVLNAQSIYSIATSPETEGTEQAVVGLSGAWIGYKLFNGLFGWASIPLSFLLFFAGVALLWCKQSDIWRILGRLVQVLAFSLWLSLLLATLQTLLGANDAVLSWGGELGVLYETSITKQYGMLGLGIFLALSLLILLVICSDRVMLAVNEAPNMKRPTLAMPSWLASLMSKLRSRKDDDEDEEDEEDDEDDDTEEDEEEDSTSSDREIPSTPSTIISLGNNEEQTEQTERVTDTNAGSTDTEAEDTTNTLIVERALDDDLVDSLDDHTPYTPGLALAHYRKPTLDMLVEYGSGNLDVDMNEIEMTKQLILKTLSNFKIQVVPHKATVGPTVTLYEVVPDPGVKVARILGLIDDLALALKSEGIRIIAPMPGLGTVGIEVPNKKPQTVSMRSVMGSRAFSEALEKMELPIGIGKTITNEPFTFDLAKMPHLLIAGATGQGKSVGLNALITSLLYAKRPEELKFIMVDPKMLEFSLYEELERHFMAMLPDSEKAIITDMSRVVPTLNSLCVEMDNRYELLTRAKVRNIKEYNEQVRSGKLSRLDGFEFLPYIVLIVDEFADLIMTRGKEVEQPIARLAQKARAAGIHMVIATQRPSTDVITGLIKANFPARIAFKVFSMVDSRTILDSPGANNLVGRGDMLFYQGKDMVRVQCAFMDTPETQVIVEHISRQESEGTAYMLPEYIEEGGASEAKDFNPRKKDALFEEAARLVVTSQVGSASVIQRKLEVGFARAGRIVDQLEGAGILGPQRGSKPRELLVTDLMALEELLDRLR